MKRRMRLDLELAKTAARSGLDDAVYSLFDDAADVVQNQDLGKELDNTPATESRVAQEMLKLAEKRRHLFLSVQALLTGYIARQDLWEHHPAGYDSLREFLMGAGLHVSVVSHLVSIGETIIPFCDAKKVAIDQALLPANFEKLRSAIGAVNRAIRDDNADTVQEIIDLVNKAPNRETVRYQVQKHRERPGHGTVLRQGNSSCLVVYFPENTEHVARAIASLSGTVQWDLIASYQPGHSAKGNKTLSVLVFPGND